MTKGKYKKGLGAGTIRQWDAPEDGRGVFQGRKARRLTAREAEWVKKLGAVLSSCPPSLCLLTTGSKDLQVIDQSLINESGDLESDELADGAPHTNGLLLAYVESACFIHGVG